MEPLRTFQLQSVFLLCPLSAVWIKSLTWQIQYGAVPWEIQPIFWPVKFWTVGTDSTIKKTNTYPTQILRLHFPPCPPANMLPLLLHLIVLQERWLWSICFWLGMFNGLYTFNYSSLLCQSIVILSLMAQNWLPRTEREIGEMLFIQSTN